MNQPNKLIKEDLTQTLTILGLPETKITVYTEPETKALKSELIRYALAKQETIPVPVINEWLLTFQEMNIKPDELAMRIKMAKYKKRYGNQTTLADFMDLDDEYYTEYYNYYKRKIIPSTHRLED